MIKKILIGLLALMLLIAGFVFHTFNSTGYFREINSTPAKVVQKIPLKGAEDLTIDYDADLMFISAFNRRNRWSATGGLYKLDLTQQPFSPVRLVDGLGKGFHPHGISLLKMDSARYRLFVINHQGEHTIEVFDVLGDSLVQVASYQDELFISPNDIVAIDSMRFYFTNDHGKTSKWGRIAEDYLGLVASNVVYFDGTDFQIVADGIAYANGINISADKQQLYVASPRAFNVFVFDILAQGRLEHVNDIPTGTGVDNLEWDTEGKLWSGAHPNLLAFTAYAGGKTPVAPTDAVLIKGDKAEIVFTDTGENVSGASVAVPYKDMLFIGNVMDEHLLVVKRNQPFL